MESYKMVCRVYGALSGYLFNILPDNKFMTIYKSCWYKYSR